MKKIVVSASSMPAGRNMSSQLEYLTRVTNYGADMYHLDVMDGTITKHKSIDYAYMEQLIQKSTLLFDVHLMVKDPDMVLRKYIKNGAHILTVHYEVYDDVEDLISSLKYIRSKGVMAGLAIQVSTDIKVIDRLIKYVDVVLLMCAEIGACGQKFNDSVLKKIKYVRNLSSEVLIEVDAGINDVTGAQCVKAGADILVSGNYIFNNDTYVAIQALKGKNG